MKREIGIAAISANLYPSFLYVLPDLVWLGFIAILFQNEIREVIKAKLQKHLKHYFSDFWNTLDWVTIVLGIVIGVSWLDMIARLSTVSEAVVNLPEPPDTIDPLTGETKPSDSAEIYHEKW